MFVILYGLSDFQFTIVSVPPRSSNPAVLWLGQSYFGVKGKKNILSVTHYSYRSKTQTEVSPEINCPTNLIVSFWAVQQLRTAGNLEISKKKKAENFRFCCLKRRSIDFFFLLNPQSCIIVPSPCRSMRLLYCQESLKTRPCNDGVNSCPMVVPAEAPPNCVHGPQRQQFTAVVSLLARRKTPTQWPDSSARHLAVAARSPAAFNLHQPPKGVTWRLQFQQTCRRDS